jgi:pyrroline-5-carboxylate reductase
MQENTIGFVGAGRITRIMLRGLKRAGALPAKIFVTDTDAAALEKTAALFPEVTACPEGAARFGWAGVVFFAVHPPVLAGALAAAGPCLSPGTIVCSLAPKMSVTKIGELLDGRQAVCRMNPNAPSVVGAGFNPVYFPPSFPAGRKKELLALFAALGQCPEVDEKKLEAFAVISAMGPTYLWFQLYTLLELAQRFGLNDGEARSAVSSMTIGAGLTMREEGLPSAEVMDLVPVKPLAEHEDEIRKIYETKLTALYAKLTS